MSAISDVMRETVSLPVSFKGDAQQGVGGCERIVGTHAGLPATLILTVQENRPAR